MKQINLYVTEEDKEKLDLMCEKTSRKQSDMVRHLIRQTYDAMFQQPEKRNWEADGDYAAAVR
jgi:predicted DNA-binding protein